jgi:hypothetical protein
VKRSSVWKSKRIRSKSSSAKRSPSSNPADAGMTAQGRHVTAALE